MLKNNPVLLDTHVWYWLIAKWERVHQPKILNRISKAQENGNLCLAAMSIWEIGMLYNKKRIAIYQDLNNWVDAAILRSHIQLLPPYPEIALNSSNLPGDPHGDPADKIIIASAIYLGATLISADKKIISYCKKQQISYLSIA